MMHGLALTVRRWDSYKNHRDWKWVEFTHCHWLVFLYRNSDFLYKRESYFIAEVVIMTPLSTHKEPDVIALGSSDCRKLWSLGSFWSGQSLDLNFEKVSYLTNPLLIMQWGEGVRWGGNQRKASLTACEIPMVPFMWALGSWYLLDLFTPHKNVPIDTEVTFSHITSSCEPASEPCVREGQNWLECQGLLSS